MYARPSRILWRLAQILVTLAVATYVANGQSAPDLRIRAGVPVLVYQRDAPVRESVFLSATPSALHVRDACDSCTLAVLWTQLTRVDAFVAQGPSPGRVVGGALLGGGATLLLILGTGLVTAGVAGCEWDRPGGSCPALGLAAATPILVGIGTGIGAIAGYRSRPRRWTTVWPALNERAAGRAR